MVCTCQVSVYKMVDIENNTLIKHCNFMSYHLQVIRSTGFMKGLYGENEMKSDNVKVSQTVCLLSSLQSACQPCAQLRY